MSTQLFQEQLHEQTKVAWHHSLYSRKTLKKDYGPKPVLTINLKKEET